jgi:O-antigen ligase
MRISGDGHPRDSWIVGGSVAAVTACVFVIPFILGGNRPLAWPIATLILAPFALMLALGILTRGDRRLTRIDPGLPAVLYGLLFAYVLAQCLPIAGYLPAQWLALPAGVDAGEAISLSPGDTLLTLLRWTNVGLLAFLVLHISASRSRSERLFFLLFCVGMLHAAYGLVLRYQFGDTILFAPKWAYLGSATGAFVNRNSFATFLSIAAVLSVVLLLKRLKERRLRSSADVFSHLSITHGALLPALGTAIVLAALISTNSRLGAAAGLAGILVTVALLIGGRGAQRGAALVMLAILCCFALALMLFGDSLIDRVGLLQNAAEVRGDLYHQVWGMILDRPWTGYGGGAFEIAYPLFHRPPVDPDLVWDHAHSSYLALWVDYGLIFGSLPLLALLIVFARLIVVFTREPGTDPLIVAGIGSTVVVAIHSIADFSLEIHGVTLLYTAVLSLAFGRALNKPPKKVRPEYLRD